jgi:hypothetical protein
MSKREKQRTLVSGKIKDLVCNYYNLDIEKPVRRNNYVEARMIYYKLVRDNTHYSLSRIGSTVSRDHATVLYSLRNFKEWVETDKELRTDYEILKEQLNNIINDDPEGFKVIEAKTIEGHYRQLYNQKNEKYKVMQKLLDEYRPLAEKYYSLSHKYKYLLSKLRQYAPNIAKDEKFQI